MKVHRPSFRTPMVALVCGVMTLLLAGAPVGSAPVPSPRPAPTPVPSSSPGGSAAGVSFLEGTASWDIELVREYIKKVQKVDMAATPAPYPQQDMLSKVNPEFAKRVDALMALYQAHGGDKSPEVVKDLGIVPKTGGFRRPQEQIELYKECRRIKKIAGKPVGDGSKPEHWEIIPPAERVAGWATEYERRIVPLRIEEGDSIVLHVPRDQKLEPNCHVFRLAWDYRTQTHVEVMGPVTHTWVGWHNYGLAADFSQVISAVVDGKKIQALALPIGQNNVKKKAFEKMLDAVGSLGMTWGGWWQGAKNDPAHVEWHPRLRDPDKLTPSETALALTAEQMGYKWKIPSRIFLLGRLGWFGTVMRLTVLELVAEGGWISVKGQRTLYYDSPDRFRGFWTSYDPPVKLFPVYIATTKLERDEGKWPEDVKWRGKTTVTLRSFVESVDATGKVAHAMHSESTGVGHFGYQLYVTDWQKAGIPSIEGKFTNAGHYARLRDSSVYEISVSILVLNDPKERVSTKSRDVRDGYTSDSSVEGQDNILNMLPQGWGGLRLAWNRDNGMIDAEVRLVKVEGGQVYDLTNTDSQETVLDRLPNYVRDREKAPAWTSPNPRPSPKPRTTCPPGGWLCR